MSKGLKLEELLLEKSKTKLLQDVHTLDPQQLLAWFNQDSVNFQLLVKKVSKVIKANPKLVTKIREGK
jgi:hypothetical protein